MGQSPSIDNQLEIIEEEDQKFKQLSQKNVSLRVQEWTNLFRLFLNESLKISELLLNHIENANELLGLYQPPLEYKEIFKYSQQQQIQFIEQDILYIGQWHSGQQCGFGQMFFENVNYYVGFQFCGKPFGHGRMVYKDGSFYEGEWILGKPYNSGKFYAKNGDIEYILQQRSPLEFVQNQDPSLINNNKSYYYGQLVKGQQQGFGYQEWIDGTYYIGEFQNGKRHGIGRMKYANGMKYFGEFIQNKYQGLGYLKYPDGSFFFGKLFQNLRQGFGILKLNENHRMEGYFRLGKYNGRILEVHQNGIKVTFWDDGKQLSQEECKQKGYLK